MLVIGFFYAPSLSVFKPVVSITQTSSNSGEEKTIEMIDRVSKAVVSIQVRRRVPGGASSDPFSVPTLPSTTATRERLREIGGGSGFFVSADGLVVTNRHVVDDERAQYTVVTQDKYSYVAQVVALDPVLDIALLKIDAEGMAYVSFANTDSLRVGQTVFAIGNALAEFQNTVTKGVVSGLDRRVYADGPVSGSEVIESAIQTDAAVNPGSSGGPLVDLRGEVVGMNTAVSEAAQSLGFALPARLIAYDVQSFQRQNRIVHAWLGVRFMPVDEELAETYHLPYAYGDYVLRGSAKNELAVIAGSPADKAGLQERDVILEVNGKKITEANSLSTAVSLADPGSVMHLKIWHEGKERDVEVILAERPSNQ